MNEFINTNNNFVMLELLLLLFPDAQGYTVSNKPECESKQQALEFVLFTNMIYDLWSGCLDRDIGLASERNRTTPEENLGE